MKAKNYLSAIRWKKKKFIINKFITQSRLHFDSLLLNAIMKFFYDSIFFFLLTIKQQGDS